jgi:hypothetical protein
MGEVSVGLVIVTQLYECQWLHEVSQLAYSTTRFPKNWPRISVPSHMCTTTTWSKSPSYQCVL